MFIYVQDLQPWLDKDLTSNLRPRLAATPYDWERLVFITNPHIAGMFPMHGGNSNKTKASIGCIHSSHVRQYSEIPCWVVLVHIVSPELKTVPYRLCDDLTVNNLLTLFANHHHNLIAQITHRTMLSVAT